MENFLTQLTALFATFLVLAAGVEAVLEVVRGLLDKIGLRLRRGLSLEEAMAIADQATDGKPDVHARHAALRAFSEDLARRGVKKREVIEAVLDLGGKPVEQELTRIAGELKAFFDADERRRLTALRGLALVMGCALVWLAGAQILVLVGREVPRIVDILVGGFAAAAGSSYWHDKLDGLRKLKDALSAAAP
jgi:hypothetical protein